MDEVELLVAVVDPVDYLKENKSGIFLIQPAFLFDQGKQLATPTEIHNVDHVLVHHESTQVRDDVLVFQLLDTLLLGVDGRHTRGVSVGFRIDELDCYFLAGLLVNTKHDQSEASLA